MFDGYANTGLLELLNFKGGGEKRPFPLEKEAAS